MKKGRNHVLTNIKETYNVQKGSIRLVSDKISNFLKHKNRPYTDLSGLEKRI